MSPQTARTFWLVKALEKERVNVNNLEISEDVSKGEIENTGKT